MRKLLLAAALAGLAGTGPAAAQDGDYDAATVLATVEGTDITLGHLIALLGRLPEQYQQAPDDMLYGALLDQLIDQTLLAHRQSVSPDEDPREVRLTLENERRAALATLELQKLAEIEPDAAAVEAAYDEAFGSFEPETEYNASHILVESEEEAQALREQIDAGADFGELAGEHSIDGSASAGGELGWFGPGRMVPEFEAAVKELEPGSVAGPVETQFGWHLIRLNDTRDSTAPSLEEVRPQIEEQIREDKVRVEIEALREAAEIDRPETGVPAAAIREADLITE